MSKLRLAIRKGNKVLIDGPCIVEVVGVSKGVENQTAHLLFHANPRVAIAREEIANFEVDTNDTANDPS